ncbi:hypothetical protein FH972_022875 [Carpinus fangiana]|uniref:Alpha-galactosidase n=1 Tax=Carpinus fangiana TaxID=176857 RepID=A0A5N6KTI4_9ROSI|nr:hypothetical protein FH972_022875 [Carpinus fangiana]
MALVESEKYSFVYVRMKTQSAIVLGTALPVYLAVALQDGFGQTPILGFNTYNDVACSPNSTYVEDTINALAAKGFASYGYRYFQVDCGWQGFQRLDNGSITYDESVFPGGIKPLSDLAISKGFQWSMYTDQGLNACDTLTDKLRPGSLGYETEDAAMFRAWNAEYVKVDNCYINGPLENAPKDPRTDFPSRFGNMSSALQDVGIKGMLVCQWGVPYQSPTGLQGPAIWTPAVATSYRVSDDIAQGWPNVQRIMNQAIHVNLNDASGPGSFADMDLLEVGNAGMTLEEQKSHFAIWAMFKSALMISTSILDMSQEVYNVLTNKMLISINQDNLGAPVKLVQRYSDDHDVFAGPLANGDHAVLLLDHSNENRVICIDFADLGIVSADVEDLWSGDNTQGATLFSAHIGPHGNAALRLSNISKIETPPSYQLQYIEAESGRLEGGANVQTCSGCSQGSKVGYIGSGATLTFEGIRASKDSMDIYFDYIDCEIGYLSTQGLNVRGASISVNSGPAQSVHFPLTGYDWDKDLLKGFKVSLSGFQDGQNNILTISALPAVSQFAPDFDRIGFY